MRDKKLACNTLASISSYRILGLFKILIESLLESHDELTNYHSTIVGILVQRNAWIVNLITETKQGHLSFSTQCCLCNDEVIEWVERYAAKISVAR